MIEILRCIATPSTSGQYLAGIPRLGQWLAFLGSTPIASARGRTPPKAAMTSECDNMLPLLKTFCLKRKPIFVVSYRDLEMA